MLLEHIPAPVRLRIINCLMMNDYITAKALYDTWNHRDASYQPAEHEQIKDQEVV
ncbi:MAG TPA: hypothetical protein VHZ76_04400 [Gammaproteobacteria bacterium]|jgi:hypothetical protein|nr:hypothetical protein [Gammaproteobacteria bacterium]